MLNKYLGEEVVIYKNGEFYAEGILKIETEINASNEREIYPYFVDCGDKDIAVTEEILEGCTYSNGDILTMELKPINVKLQRANAKVPERIGGSDKSCWFDTYVSDIKVVGEEVREALAENKPYLRYHKGDIVTVSLGFSLDMPKGKEAVVVPRSSTFKKYGLLLVNSQGVIDTAYSGDGDEWLGVFLAVTDGRLDIGDRVLQFRIQNRQPDYVLNVVESLGNKDRGGFGTTGRK